jgi:hypothetical protein
MSELITAYTKMTGTYPGYINVSREDDGTVVIIVRADPTTRPGEYICGYARNRGEPGRV